MNMMTLLKDLEVELKTKGNGREGEREKREGEKK